MESFEAKARRLVINYLNIENNRVETIKVVWFCKTLQNWKAIVADIAIDGRLYEVTYNGDKKESYIDEYQKMNNKVVPD